MARKVADRKLDSKAERRKLKPSPKPYYREIGQGLHLGFRKGKRFGTWVVRLYAGNQTYKVESIGRADDDLADADGESVLTWHQAVEKARERQKMRTTPAGAVAGPYTVAEAVEDYLVSIEAKPSGHDARTRAETWILPALGKIDVAMLTAKQIRRWHADVAATAPRIRGKKNPGPDDKPRYKDIDWDDPEVVRRRRATANRMLTTLKAALNFAFAEAKAASDREWRRVKPFEGVDAARVRYLTLGEATRFINAAEPEFRPLAQGALQTGARYGELGRLRVEDFNPDSETVAVRKSKSRKSRHLELTDEGITFFRQITAGRAGDELMFPKEDGTAWGKSHQERPMAEACERAKITPPIGFHILRHTWASHAVMNGVPLMVVAKNLGHADTRMVEKFYGHLAPSYIRDAIRAGAPRFGFEPDRKVAAMAGRA